MDGHPLGRTGCEYDSQCESAFCSRPFLSCAAYASQIKEGATCDPRQQSCEQGSSAADFVKLPTPELLRHRLAVHARSGREASVRRRKNAFRAHLLQGMCSKPKGLMEPCRVTSDCDLTKDLYCVPAAVRTPAHKPRTLRSVKRAAFPALSCARPRAPVSVLRVHRPAWHVRPYGIGWSTMRQSQTCVPPAICAAECAGPVAPRRVSSSGSWLHFRFHAGDHLALLPLAKSISNRATPSERIPSSARVGQSAPVELGAFFVQV